MKSINKKLMKAKLKNYKKYKEKNKEHELELDLNNQANQMHGKCLLLQAKIRNY